MEASMIFHFAGRGSGEKRLALLDFAQLLDPRWRAPHEEFEAAQVKSSFAQGVLRSAYNFVQGGKLFIRYCSHNSNISIGIAGSFGATIVYPIDMGK